MNAGVVGPAMTPDANARFRIACAVEELGMAIAAAREAAWDDAIVILMKEALKSTQAVAGEIT